MQQKEVFMVPDSEMQEVVGDAFDQMLSAHRKLKTEKPEERSEKARRYAVCITELEKVMSYYLIMCSNDDFTG